MRLTLSNTLRTRPGNYLKDARLVNAYPDVKNEEATVRKRPGCVPSSYNFTTPQAFSSIADLMLPLPYGTLGDISDLIFSISGDSYAFTDLASYPGTPGGGAVGARNPTLIGTKSSFLPYNITTLAGVMYGVNALDNYLYKSADFGASWTIVSSTNAGYGGLCPVDISIVNIGGVLYGIDSVSAYGFHSTNGGVTWVCDFGNPWISEFYFVNGSIAITAQSGNDVGTSSDFANWTTTGASAPNIDPNGGMAFVGGKYFCLSKTAGSIRSSSDLVTWTTSTGFGFLTARENILFTDGTSLYLLRVGIGGTGFTILTINPATMVITNTYADAAYAWPSGADGFGSRAERYVQNIGGSLYLVTTDGSYTSRTIKL